MRGKPFAFKLSELVVISAVLGAGGCATEVDDLTGDLTYNPPINEQSFVARVRTNQSLRGVEFDLRGAGVAPMAAIGGNRYVADLPLAACQEVAEYNVLVTVPRTIGGGTQTRRFPATGTFRAPVTGQPASCARFSRATRTFDVDNVNDLPDANPGDGECRTSAADGSVCTLRAAVMEANARLGVDLIRLPIARYRLTRTGPETDAVPDDAVGDLDLTEAVTIQGQGVAGDVTLLDFLACTRRSSVDGRCFFDSPATDLADDPAKDRAVPKIDAGGIDRVFQIHGNVNAEAPAGLRDLAVIGGDSRARPGGGVRNDGALVLERVAVIGNAVSEGSRVPGGGVANFGVLNGEEVAFAQNRVTGTNPSAGAFHNHSGAEARLNRALFAFNKARFSSALRNAGPSGEGEDDGGRVTVENATFFNNPVPPGITTVVNVIGDGGSLDLAFVTVAGQVDTARVIEGNASTRLRDALLVNNRGSGSGIAYCAGGLATGGGNVTDEPCRLSGTGLAPDVIAASGNIVSGALEDRGDFLPVYPLFRPLEGRTNPAIDAGSAPPFPFDDQRGPGFDRRVDGDRDGDARPDAGAFELGAGPSA